MLGFLEYFVKPCTRWMMQLKLPAKFALISLAFVAPMGVTLYALLSYASSGIEFAESERSGIDYLKELNGLLGANFAKGVDTSALQRIVQRDADALKITQGIAKLSDARGGDLEDAMLELYADVGSNSQLVLDPDLDSYYVMTVALDLSPRLLLAERSLSKVMASNALGQPLDDITKMQFRYLSGRVAEIQLTINQALQRATGATPGLKRQIESEWYAAVDALTAAARSNSASGMSLTNDAMAKTLKLNEQSIAALDQLLASRIGKLQRQRNIYLVVTTLGLLVAAYLITGFYFSSIKGFGAVVHRLENLAIGNLTPAFPAQGRDEISELIGSFDATRDHLQGLVMEIRHVASTINTAGQEISSANTDLATRTSKQSTLIGNTSHQISQANQKVRSNLEAAANANQISLEALQAADGGKSVMDMVVSTMSTMKGSSTRIGSIIDAINEIAFQTNLLALNAAVEAARAGEHGRGFAVVAGEVRHLAQRCAAEANQINQLVKASVEDVNKGVVQVAAAGKSMEEILSTVSTVSAIMGEMTDAGKSQADAMNKVQGAMQRIDDDGQQNAAMVEQTASAAELLRQQVGLLMHAISTFHLADDSNSGVLHSPVSPQMSTESSRTRRAA